MAPLSRVERDVILVSAADFSSDFRNEDRGLASA